MYVWIPLKLAWKVKILCRSITRLLSKTRKIKMSWIQMRQNSKVLKDQIATLKARIQIVRKKLIEPKGVNFGTSKFGVRIPAFHWNVFNHTPPPPKPVCPWVGVTEIRNFCFQSPPRHTGFDFNHPPLVMVNWIAVPVTVTDCKGWQSLQALSSLLQSVV